MSIVRSLRLFPLLAAPALVVVTPAYAQEGSTDNSATVETLFGAGKALVAQGKFSEACPKFLASYNLEHRIGTVLNLADCYEKNQQLASAWARYIEAATLAQRAGQSERAAFATTHAKALEPTLSKLTVAVPGATAVAGLVLRRDGITVDPAVYGVAVAVDGGTHTIEASAPGKKPWSSQVVVASSSEAKTVTVPALEDGPQPLETAQPSAPAASPAAPDVHTNGGNVRVAGFVVGGAGALGLVAGSIFGAMAGSKASAAKRECVPVSNCQANTNPAASSDMNTAGTLADVSTVAFVAGGALVATGVVLYLVGRPKASAAAFQWTPTVAAHGGGMGFSGAW
jgi:hypothetical protein